MAQIFIRYTPHSSTTYGWQEALPFDASATKARQDERGLPMECEVVSQLRGLLGSCSTSCPPRVYSSMGDSECEALALTVAAELSLSLCPDPRLTAAGVSSLAEWRDDLCPGAVNIAVVDAKTAIAFESSQEKAVERARAGAFRPGGAPRKAPAPKRTRLRAS